ncbi:MAG: efflux RND transporter permease subunit, partial [Myxococcota bacterium]
ERVVPMLQRIEGVGELTHLGGRDRVYRVDVDITKLAARGISISSLVESLRSELADISGGEVNYGRRRLAVRTLALPPNPEDLRELRIGVGQDGTPIHLSQVADIRMGLRDPSTVAFQNDLPSMVLLVRRESGSNVLEVTRKIRAEVARMNEALFAPEGLSFQVVSDQVGYIESAIDQVRQNLLLGGVLAVLVLFLALRSVAASMIVAVAIPICVFGTMLGMQWMGRSLNVVSLAGITFAIGMVLDNSIVSLESIDTWSHRVGSAREASVRGVAEVWGALLASTATTAAVFLPVITWESEVGQLLRDISVAVSVAVLTSLFVSIWVIPSLSSRLLRKRRPASEPDSERASGALQRFGASARRSLGRAVYWVSQSTLRSLAIVGVALTLCIAATTQLLPPLEYLPRGNRNLVFGVLVPPAGTSVSELERAGLGVQKQLSPHVGKVVDGVPAIRRSFFVGTPTRLFGGAVAEDPSQIGGILRWLRRVQSEIPGYFSFTTQASLFGRRGGGRTIEVNVSGGDLAELTKAGRLIFDKLREVLPSAQIRPIPALDAGALELRARPRRDSSATLGMSTSEIGQTLDVLVDGAVIGELGDDGAPRLDVILRAVRGDGAPIETTSELESAPVSLASGQVVPFGVLAELSEELGPTVIRRIERSRAITLQVSPEASMPLSEALALIDRDVLEPIRSGAELSRRSRITVSGTVGDLAIAKEQFASVLWLALLISYLLMSALFEDFLAPLVVLLTVPLASAGGAIALHLLSAFAAPQALDLVTALGFLILLGVVVNNAILVVDGALARLRQGETIESALRLAVESRARPVWMTTLTSLAGLLPMVWIPGSGTELYRGTGAVVLGGLLMSTMLTLVVIPSGFSIVWRLRQRLGVSASRVMRTRTSS